MAVRQKVLITGASSGIGKATAMRFAGGPMAMRFYSSPRWGATSCWKSTLVVLSPTPLSPKQPNGTALPESTSSTSRLSTRPVGVCTGNIPSCHDARTKPTTF